MFGSLDGLQDFGFGVDVTSLRCANNPASSYPCEPDADGWQRYIVLSHEVGNRHAPFPDLELYMMGLISLSRRSKTKLNLLTNYQIEDGEDGLVMLAVGNVVYRGTCLETIFLRPIHCRKTIEWVCRDIR